MPFCPRSQTVLLQGLMVLAVVVLSGCSEHTVNIPRWAPAAVHLEGVGSLAVGSFAGKGGDDWAELLRVELLEADYFAIVNASEPVHTLNHQAQPDDPSQAHQADAVVQGEIVYAEQVVTYEATLVEVGQRTQCQLGRTVRVQLEVDVAIIDSQQDRPIVQQRLRFDEPLQTEHITVFIGATKQACNLPSREISSHFPLLEGDQLQLRAKARLAHTLVTYLTPQWHSEPVTFYADPRLGGAQQGVEAARAGRWAEAIDFFTGARSEAYSHGLNRQYLAKAHYNLAVALAYGRDYDEGIKELQRACELMSDPLFVAAMEQIEQSQRDEQIAQARQQTVQCLRDVRGRPACSVLL